jgi:hypothetical protein
VYYFQWSVQCKRWWWNLVNSWHQISYRYMYSPQKITNTCTNKINLKFHPLSPEDIISLGCSRRHSRFRKRDTGHQNIWKEPLPPPPPPIWSLVPAMLTTGNLKKSSSDNVLWVEFLFMKKYRCHNLTDILYNYHSLRFLSPSHLNFNIHS